MGPRTHDHSIFISFIVSSCTWIGSCCGGYGPQFSSFSSLDYIELYCRIDGFGRYTERITSAQIE